MADSQVKHWMLVGKETNGQAGLEPSCIMGESGTSLCWSKCGLVLKKEGTEEHILRSCTTALREGCYCLWHDELLKAVA